MKNFLAQSSFCQPVIFGFLALCLQVPSACSEPDTKAGHAGEGLDRATCSILETLLKDIDRGLKDIAGDPESRRPASGVSVYAQEALNMADSSSGKKQMPEDIKQALSGIVTAASSGYFFSDAASKFLEHGLVLQSEVPQVCPDISVSDMGRHTSLFREK